MHNQPRATCACYSDAAEQGALVRRNKRDGLIRDVIDTLLGRTDRLSISTLACRNGLSVRRLEELFKEETGVTIRGFYKCLRLHRAAALLVERDTKASVKAVQFDAG